MLCGSLLALYVQPMNESTQYTREEIRLKILRLLDDDPNLSQRRIASRLGVSLGSVNYCLRALVEKGWIKVNNFRRSDIKMAYAYILTPRGVAERALLTKLFLRRKLTEYDQLKAEIAQLERQMSNDNRLMVTNEKSSEN